MLRPFRLKRPVDPDSAMDPDDVLTTKKMLNGLGFMKLPDYGLTPYPDRPMIDAVKSFQRKNRLRADGVMKPDGATLKGLNQSLAARRKEIGQPIKTQPVALGLTDEVGFQRKNKSHDVFSTRQALTWAGYPPRKSTHASDGLIKAIENFQGASGLKADGFLRPFGETEIALNRALAAKVQAMRRQGVSRAGNSGTGEGRTDEQTFALPAIPAIVLKIAEFYGIAVMAAWAWWQSMSEVEKTRIRRQVTGNGPSDGGGNEDACDHLHFNVDIPTCNAIGERRGKQAAQRCYHSANERYAACLRGVPLDRLPPLDIWNH